MEHQEASAGAPRRAISPVQGRFLLALRGGATVEDAAEAAGLAATTLDYRRRVDPDFAALWREAGAAAEADAATAPAGESAAKDAAHGTVVRDHADRGIVRKRRCTLEFTRTRKQTFLDHFAGNCNMPTSAAAAGVTVGTVRKALADDRAFAEGFDPALTVGYKALEAERSVSSTRLRKSIGCRRPTIRKQRRGRGAGPCSCCEYRRKDGSIGRRPRGTRPWVVNPEEVRVAVAKALHVFGKRAQAMGYRIPGNPPGLPGPEAGAT